MKFFRLEFNTWGYDWENTEIFFSKTREEINSKLQELTLSHESCSSEGHISEVSYEEMKEEITISEFEELFDTKINLPMKVEG